MSSIWTKSAVVAASTALISLAFVPALAQPAEIQPSVEEVQPPPEEVVPPGEVRQSRPRETEGTPRELRLGGQNAAGVCTTKADNAEDAAIACTKNLNCTPPAKPVCQERRNFQDYRCVCK